MHADISELIGQTMMAVGQPANSYGDELVFVTTDGKVYKFYHSQDCCERVSIDDIVGDLDDLVGAPILQAAEESSDLPAKDTCTESYTWTFYNFATIKGSVTVKWYGESNGYYSESVEFCRVE